MRDSSALTGGGGSQSDEPPTGWSASDCWCFTEHSLNTVATIATPPWAAWACCKQLISGGSNRSSSRGCSRQHRIPRTQHAST